MARDRLAEISEKRARGQRSGWWRGKSELEVLESEWRRGTGPLQIPAQFVAIRLVTILEVFTRDWVAELIDAGDPYTARGGELVKGSLKIDYAMAQALVGKQLTFGELVSHDIPVNDIGDIERAFSSLIGESFFGKLASVTDRWALRDGEGAPKPILGDPAWARAQIGRLFVDRHIIVHELPDDRSVALEAIGDYARATSLFVEVADQYLQWLLHGDYPATQAEMNEAAARKAEVADAELRVLVGQLDPDNSDGRLAAAQSAWEDYRLKQAQYRAGGSGSIAPMLFADEMEKLTRERIELLRWYRDREEGDM